jgi:hypothetical protein
VFVVFKAKSAIQQLSMGDSYFQMPPDWQEQLKTGWAEQFYQQIYSKVNEERFSVLYSSNYSRPNKPVRLIVSLLILKSLKGLSDAELLESLKFDQRFWYALGISTREDAVVSVNTLTNFRARLIDHQADGGADLFELEVKSLSDALAVLIGLNRKMARMDSFMISSACRDMTRLELIYTVVYNAVKALSNLDETAVPEPLKPFLEEGHRKEHVYAITDEEVPDKLSWLIRTGGQLSALIQERTDDHSIEAFALLRRLLSEQAAVGPDGVLTPKDPKELESSRLQNPSDPDATHRVKGGVGSTGYACNIVEVRDQDKKVSMILDHTVEQNIHSDQEFGEEFLQNSPLAEEIEVLATDGAFHRVESQLTAEEKGIEWNISNIPGRSLTGIGVDQFVRGDDNLIQACPAGHAPVQSTYNAEKQQYKAKFDKTVCSQCPLQAGCPAQQQKKAATVSFKETKLQTDRARSRLGTQRHKELSNFRAGVEGTVSAVKRGLKQLPVFGLLRSKIWIHGRIMAFNFNSLVRYLEYVG